MEKQESISVSPTLEADALPLNTDALTGTYSIATQKTHAGRSCTPTIAVFVCLFCFYFVLFVSNRLLSLFCISLVVVLFLLFFLWFVVRGFCLFVFVFPVFFSFVPFKVQEYSIHTFTSMATAGTLPNVQQHDFVLTIPLRCHTRSFGAMTMGCYRRKTINHSCLISP